MIAGRSKALSATSQDPLGDHFIGEDKMKEFFTREVANEGKKVPLYLPNGEKSEHWLVLLGTDSDQFRLTEARSKRNVIEFAQIESASEREEAVEDAKRTLVASLISDWSFDQDCDEANKIELLKNAPQIGNMINLYCADRKNFFK